MNNRLLKLLAAILLCISVFSAALFIPPASALLIPVFIAVAAWIFSTGGIGLLAALCVIQAVGIFFVTSDLPYALIFSVIPSVSGTAVAYAIAKKHSLKQTLVIAGFGVAVFLATIFALASNSIEGGIFALFRDAVSAMLSNPEFAAIAAQYGINMSELTAAADGILTQMYHMLPYYFVAFSAVLGYICLWIAWLLRMKNEDFERFVPHFSMFKCGRITVFIMIISFIVMQFLKNDILSIVFSNIYAITSFLLVVCGLSVVDFFLKQRRLHIILRIILLFLLFCIAAGAFGAILLSIVAIADAGYNFRRIDS